MPREVDDHPLLKFISVTRFEDLPSEITDLAALCVLDTLAAAIAGANSPVGAIAAKFAASNWAVGPCTILGGGMRRSLAAAAFANGTAANGTDLDDVGRFTWGHPGALVVPTALAAAESCGASGAQFLAAVVVGYEVAFRSGRCLNFGREGPAVNASREYRACGSWGSAACAAAVANLNHFPLNQVAHALGIAEYHSPEAPMMRDLETPAMVKHAIGYGAMNGVMAAQLASMGFTGTQSRMLHAQYDAWTRDAGSHFILPSGISWKRYSCCSFAHATLNAISKILIDHGPIGPRVRRVRVHAFSDAIRLGAGVPNSSEEAQFCISWPVAVMLLDGEVHPRAMLPERLADSRTRELAARVELVESPELTAAYLRSEAELPCGEEASIVEVQLDDGRLLPPVKGSLVLFPEWMPGRDEVEAKFRWATKYLLDQTQVDAVCHLSRELPRLPNVASLISQIALRT